MQLSFGDSTLGWKTYTLTWAWTGLLLWLTPGLGVKPAVVAWAFGASAGWILAPFVQRQGWFIPAFRLGAIVAALIAFLLLAEAQRLDALAGRRTLRRTEISLNGELKDRADKLAITGGLLIFASVALWHPMGCRSVYDRARQLLE